MPMFRFEDEFGRWLSNARLDVADYKPGDRVQRGGETVDVIEVRSGPEDELVTLIVRPEMSRLCIFCNRKADSMEHAIPDWVAKRLGLENVKLFHDPTSVIPTTRTQPIAVSSHRAEILCIGCNAHFGRLEEETIPLLEWMAKGRDLRLGADEQLLLAQWGAKTGYTLLAAEKETRTLVPREHMAWLRDNGEPHADCWLGYASWNGTTFKAGNVQQLNSPGDSREYTVYHEMLTFLNIALKVFGIIDSVPGYVIGGDKDDLRRVWPKTHRTISWPLVPAGNRNLEALLSLPALIDTTLLAETGAVDSPWQRP